MPLEIFFDSKLGILKAVVYYLRGKGLKNSEIAQILNKDQRNIWTIYSRIKKKMNMKKK